MGISYFLDELLSNGGFNRILARKLIEAGSDVNSIGIATNGLTVREFAYAEAAHAGNQDYIHVFKPETKLL